MRTPQPGILADLPPHSRYLAFSVEPGSRPASDLAALADLLAGTDAVVGLGLPLVSALGAAIDGLSAFPALAGPGIAVPSTQQALWCWLRGDDRGDLLLRGREIERLVECSFALEEVVEGFLHRGGRDLFGFEDGTENPRGLDAVAAAIVAGGPSEGSAFAAVQQWEHDLDGFEALSRRRRDLVIGRRLSDNRELEDAPTSAHVRRTAQESFDPPAFLVRRSMPWADPEGEGLLFVAFGRSLDPFARMLARMTGAEDGVADALFAVSRPISGAYWWCPPLDDGRLDLSQLGL